MTLATNGRTIRRTGVLLSAVFAALLVGSSALRAAKPNPLIGKWKFSGRGFVDRDGHNWCNLIVEIDFSRNSKTVITAAQTSFIPPRPGTRTTTPAFYAIYDKKIYVSGTDGLIEGPYFTMLDDNHMQDDTIGHCIYQRE